MKRPEIVTVFAPTNRPLHDVVRSLLDVLPDGDPDLALRGDLARIEYDPQTGTYDFVDEQLHVVQGVDDLIARLTRQRGGMWRCAANLRFHASEIYVFHYFARENDVHLHTAVSTDSHVTRFLEEETAGRGAYFAYLGRLAAAMGASYFVSGLGLESLRPLSQTNVASRAGFEATFGTSPYPYIIGWQEQALDAAKVAAGWGQEPSDVQRTLSGYAVLHRFPDAR
jgi:hypothetical protein